MSYYDRDYYRPSGFGGFSVFPPVIKNLLIINGVVFFVKLMMKNITIDGVYAEDIIIRWFALMPIGTGYFEIWQLVTYQFLHGGFSHILFNMFALWMFGMEIENQWGGKKFLIFYLLCGVGAGLLHLFISPLLTGAAPTIGASGAVYGIMAAFALIYPNRLIYLYFFIPIKAKYLITFLILMEFMLVDSVGSGVAHLAHLGGAIVGFIFVMLDDRTNVELKDTINILKTRRRQSSNSNSFFGKKATTQEAKYYDIEEDDETISQEEIDAILDKISQSGYKNLSEREKRILFEASKKMK